MFKGNERAMARTLCSAPSAATPLCTYGSTWTPYSPIPSAADPHLDERQHHPQCTTDAGPGQHDQTALRPGALLGDHRWVDDPKGIFTARLGQRQSTELLLNDPGDGLAQLHRR